MEWKESAGRRRKEAMCWFPHPTQSWGSAVAAWSWLFLTLLKTVQPQGRTKVSRTLTSLFAWAHARRDTNSRRTLDWAEVGGLWTTGWQALHWALGVWEAWKIAEVGTHHVSFPTLCFSSSPCHSNPHTLLHSSHLATLLDYSIFNSLCLINYEISNFTTRPIQRSYFSATVILPFEY